MGTCELDAGGNPTMGQNPIQGGVEILLVASCLRNRGNPAMGQNPIQGGVEIVLVASCLRNRGKLWPNDPRGWYTDFPFTYLDTAFFGILFLDHFSMFFFSVFSLEF